MSLVAAWLILAIVSGSCGWVLVGRFNPAANLPSRFGWSWLIGQAALSMGAVLCLAADRSLIWAFLLPLIVATIGLKNRLLLKTHEAEAREAEAHSVDIRDAAILRGTALALASLAIFVAWQAPRLGWDGLAIWGLKARILAETGTLSIAALLHPAAIPMHPEYPLHVPILGGLLGQLTAAFGGSWDDRILPLLAALDFSAIALLLLGAFERGALSTSKSSKLPWRWILLVGGLLAPLAWRELPEGKADLTVALCLLASTLGVIEWIRSRHLGPLWLAAVAGGLAAWSKQEGLVWLILLASLAVVFSRSRRRELLGPAGLALALALPWHLFRLHVGLAADPFSLDPGQIERLPMVAEALIFELLDYRHWGLLFFLVWPAFLWLDFRSLMRPAGQRSGEQDADLLLAGLLAAGFGTLMLIFLATPHELAWHLSTALDRLILQWWPIALLLLEASGRTFERRFAF